MIILDNFDESCSYTFRTKYFDPILVWVHEIFVGIILEEILFPTKETNCNYREKDAFFCVRDRGRTTPYIGEQ